MATFVSFYGSPSSGKTSLAMVVAIMKYLRADKRLIFLSPNLNIPSIALLFPNSNPDEIYSLASILDRPEITPEIVLKNMVTPKSMIDMGVIGFKAGDNASLFPPPDEIKVEELLNSLEELAEYIFIDCDNDINSMITKKAIERSDIVFRVVSADVRGMAWYSSDILASGNDNVFNIVVNTSDDIFLDFESVCTSLKSVLSIIPYSKKLKTQYNNGNLTDILRDNAYTKKAELLVSKIPEIRNG